MANPFLPVVGDLVQMPAGGSTQGGVVPLQNGGNAEIVLTHRTLHGYLLKELWSRIDPSTVKGRRVNPT